MQHFHLLNRIKELGGALYSSPQTNQSYGSALTGLWPQKRYLSSILVSFEVELLVAPGTSKILFLMGWATYLGTKNCASQRRVLYSLKHPSGGSSSFGFSLCRYCTTKDQSKSSPDGLIYTPRCKCSQSHIG